MILPSFTQHYNGRHYVTLLNLLTTSAGFIRVREIKKISRSGNCHGILCCVSEKWIFAIMSGNCQGIL